MFSLNAFYLFATLAAAVALFPLSAISMEPIEVIGTFPEFVDRILDDEELRSTLGPEYSKLRSEYKQQVSIIAGLNESVSTICKEQYKHWCTVRMCTAFAPRRQSWIHPAKYFDVEWSEPCVLAKMFYATDLKVVFLGTYIKRLRSAILANEDCIRQLRSMVVAERWALLDFVDQVEEYKKNLARKEAERQSLQRLQWRYRAIEQSIGGYPVNMFRRRLAPPENLFVSGRLPPEVLPERPVRQELPELPLHIAARASGRPVPPYESISTAFGQFGRCEKASVPVPVPAPTATDYQHGVLPEIASGRPVPPYESISTAVRPLEVLQFGQFGRCEKASVPVPAPAPTAMDYQHGVLPEIPEVPDVIMLDVEDEPSDVSMVDAERTELDTADTPLLDTMVPAFSAPPAPRPAPVSTAPAPTPAPVAAPAPTPVLAPVPFMIGLTAPMSSQSVPVPTESSFKHRPIAVPKSRNRGKGEAPAPFTGGITAPASRTVANARLWLATLQPLFKDNTTAVVPTGEHLQRLCEIWIGRCYSFMSKSRLTVAQSWMGQWQRGTMLSLSQETGPQVDDKQCTHDEAAAYVRRFFMQNMQRRLDGPSNKVKNEMLDHLRELAIDNGLGLDMMVFPVETG
ncbi:hypothetical protein MMYC01_206960 [Madurella mycetomatis]|uniref:Uncharacterized protein n=1 Tax=Madurella mycetomatis TaxID=100816 RepID=A0A175VXM1_9PEZI|nr:hypothetical protein MMYC01_206960 [Madurella mycetomatis]